MKSIQILSLACILSLYACKNDSTSTPTDAVQTVQKPAGENAAMVHNAVTASTSSDTVNVAQMSFESTEFAFGEVKEGTVVTHSFKFKNTGRVPLLISDARATCGCTIPEWPKDPIPVGGSSTILAKFNTEGKKETQRKEITITANTNPSTTIVALSGVVKPKK